MVTFTLHPFYSLVEHPRWLLCVDSTRRYNVGYLVVGLCNHVPSALRRIEGDFASFPKFEFSEFYVYMYVWNRFFFGLYLSTFKCESGKIFRMNST